jgi:hypothetical protein
VGTFAAPAGHYVQVEAPKETVEVMQKFFADQGGLSVNAEKYERGIA